ncbi:flagellar protein FlgN [Halioxenophilus sp. WMMB6]|uniref:flagella synthesis protein FlgN n=1 Tax=Halioxenophilus sp. WMMB6 TaxID=3073815 RepID=UPI00295E69E9|nr:flagellar protein FlgN [Halioxenophilus sp. WMMB6]
MTNTASKLSANSQTPALGDIQQNLQSDLEAAKQLAALLDQENTLLRGATATINAELSQVVEAKQAHIETLENNARQRESWVRASIARPASSKTKSSQQAMAAWLQLLQIDAELPSQWQKVESYVHICQKLNLINGRLIGFRRQRGQRLAEMLFGRPTADTYSASGQQEASRGGHSLVHA